MWLSSAILASEVSLFDMNSWWWQICKGLYWVINCIEEAYGYLVGIKTISNNAGTDAPEEVSDILFLNITDARVQKAFLIFFIAAAAILLIFLAIGMVKASFQDNDQLASRGKMVEKSFQAFFLMLLLPLIMYVGVVACGAFIRLISSVMQLAFNTSGATIAENIHQTCLPIELSGEYAARLHWNAQYSQLKAANVNETYQYVLAMLASGILIYVLIAVCTSLVERLVEVVFFYLIGPFVLARTPLDDGGSFKLWKDIIIAKMLSAAGVIISMYLYFILMQNINSWFTPIEGEAAGTVAAKGMVRILFCIGGAFAAKKGALSIAQVISQNTGISEGMGQGQSLHMLSSGLNLGMSAIRGGMMGMALAGKAGGGGTSAALRGATAGNGRFSAPVNTSDALSAGSGVKAASAGGAATAGGGFAGAGANGGVSGMSLAGGAAVAGSDAPVIDNAAAGGADWTNGVLNSPNAPGNIGKMNQAKAAGGGLGTAFMYGGGLIGGTVAAGAYLGRKAVGLATKPIKFAARKIGGSISNSEMMKEHRASKAEKQAARALKKENAANAETFRDRKQLNQEVNADMKKLSAAADKIDKKYGRGGMGYNTEAVNSIKQARLGNQMRNIERKVRRLTNAGGAYKTTLNRFNQLADTSYENNRNSNGGGKI